MFGQHNYSIFLLSLPSMYLTDAGGTKRLTCPASLTLLKLYIYTGFTCFFIYLFFFFLCCFMWHLFDALDAFVALQNSRWTTQSSNPPICWHMRVHLNYYIWTWKRRLNWKFYLRRRLYGYNGGNNRLY